MGAPSDTSSVGRAAVGVGILSLVLGAITLGTKALWYDEAFNAVRIDGSWRDLVHAVGATEMSQGVYMAGLKAWATVTPNSEAWLRFPSIVFAALAAALLVPLGTRLFDRRTGIIAGVLLATNAFVIRHAQEARTYALVTLAVVVASILFVKALDDPRRRNWLLYAVAAAAAVYCHFYAGFVVVAHLATIPFAPIRPPWRRVAEAGALFVVLISPVLYFTTRAGREQLLWIDDPSLEIVLRLFERNVGRNLILGAFAALGLVLLAYRAGSGGAVNRWRFALIGGWCVFPVALGILVSLIQPILVGRYAIVIAPAIALAAAFPIALALSRHRPVGIVVLVALLAVSGYRVTTWYRSVPEDWRSAVEYVSAQKRPGDDVVIAPFWSWRAFAYYDGEQPLGETAGKRRTFLVVYAWPRDRSELADTRVEQDLLRVDAERQFGDRLVVRIYEPRQ
ncbi:MAG: hypothetical protein EXQ81_10360 [Thermoleophilia bacterium]|nr:hypothetical protein [Thermoleophilia bacterium]